MSYKRGLAVVCGCVIAAVVAFAATYPRFNPPAHAPAAAPAGAPAPAKAVTPTLTVEIPGLQKTDPLAWSRLSNAEHVALAPYASVWNTFSEERKRKWLKIAARYPKMSPDAQKRLHDQMTEWVAMTPEQRRIARENYQISKSLSRETRQNAWKAYQQLPEEQKERLAASEHKRRPTVVSAPPSGKSEIKDINRLVNAKDRAASSPRASSAPAAVPAPAPAPAAAAAAATVPAAPAIPSAASFVPAVPTPVSPFEAPSVYNGS